MHRYYATRAPYYDALYDKPERQADIAFLREHLPARLVHFFQGLHARLLPGSRVLLIDNSEVQCKDYPIIETDADGNTYQNRPTRDGGTHRVLKNFPTEAQLRAMVEAVATNMAYQALDNFWLFEYELQ